MSTVKRTVSDRQLQLLPHQEAFVEALMAPDANDVLVLAAPAGSGKTVALVAAIERLIAVNPTSRVLVLAPAALAQQFAVRVQHVAAPVLVVDRYRFRELRNAVAHDRIWPDGMVAVMSRDFAKQPDVLSSLAVGQWDLLIIDGAERLGETGRFALSQIAAASRKIVVAATMPMDADAIVFLGDRDRTVIEWRPEEFVTVTGQPLVRRRPVLHESLYSLSAREVKLGADVEKICVAIGSTGAPGGNGIANALRRKLLSSPAALEAGLRSLTVGPESQLMVDTPAAEKMDVVAAPQSVLPMDSSAAVHIEAMLSQALQELDALGEDSKASRVIKLVQELTAGKPSSGRICILTRNTATLFYLGAVLEDTEQPIRLVHTASTVEERQRILEESASVSGVLLAQASALKGYETPEMTDLVLYELPDEATEASVLIGRFNGLGRDAPLRVHVLIAENLSSSHTVQSDLLNALGKVYRWSDHYSEARDCIERSLDFARAAGDEWRIVDRLTSLGDLDELEGRIQDSERQLGEALVLTRSGRHEGEHRRVLLGLGWVLAHRGELSRARELWNEALDSARSAGHQSDLVASLTASGWVHDRLGHGAAGLELLEEGMESARRAGNMPQLLWLLLNRATALMHRGDHDAARATLEEALQVAGKLGGEEPRVLVLEGLGFVATRIGRTTEAQRWLQSAQASASAEGRERKGAIQTFLAENALDRGLVEEAESLAMAAVGIAQQLSNPERLAFALWALARVALAKRDPARAAEQLAEAIRLSRKLQYRWLTGMLMNYLGQLQASVGQSSCQGTFAEVRAIGEEIGSLELVGLATLGDARAAMLNGDAAQARALAESARQALGKASVLERRDVREWLAQVE
jgi:tetratricopeptide (TPR) repeat protein